jgi:hypothetical protein
MPRWTSVFQVERDVPEEIVPVRRDGPQSPSGELGVQGDKQVYQWSARDKALHLLPAIPLIGFYVGTLYLLVLSSVFRAGMFLLLWIATNAAIAGICRGCPYRGGYCPGVSQLYFAPYLSALACRGEQRSTGARSLRLNLVLLGIFGFGSYAYALYWLFVVYWSERAPVVLALLVLLVLHMPLSFFILCPKCGHNDTCPMARVHKAVKKGGGPGSDGRALPRQGRPG